MRLGTSAIDSALRHLDQLRLHCDCTATSRDIPWTLIRDDFDLAVSVVERVPEDRAAHWHVEAVRWRRGDGYGKPLDLGMAVKKGEQRLQSVLSEAVLAMRKDGTLQRIYAKYHASWVAPEQ